MNDSQYHFLREDVYFEPLVHNWYAWPYLLPPITTALNFTSRNLRMMKSFVANSKLHIAANQSVSLVGGDFVSCGEDQIGNITNLIVELESKYKDYFEIQSAIRHLNFLLEKQNGLSIEHLYQEIPAILKGYIELTYDMNHHASFRLIEGLLYAGALYKRDAQSILLGMLSKVKERPFVLSTPRFPDENHLHLKVEFKDVWIDKLFMLRTEGVPKHEIDMLFKQVNIHEGLSYDSLFTTKAPSKQHLPVTEGIKISFLGHAGLMLETCDLVILIDPVIACRDGIIDDEIISFSELPREIDYVCLTHTHMDHTCIETLLQLRGRIKKVLVPKNGTCIADPSMKLILSSLGFKVREVDDLEEILLGKNRIVAMPFLGEHADLNVRSKTAWYIELQGKKIFAGADSANLDPFLYHRVYEFTGDIDMLFIGMECVGAPLSWLYGALFTTPISRSINESRRFNGSDFHHAKKIVEILKPKYVGIYALGMEPWFRYFMGLNYTDTSPQIMESNLLLQHCSNINIEAERLSKKRTWLM